MEERGTFGSYAPGAQAGTGEQMPRAERNARRAAVAVRERMQELGLSIAELSRRSGVSDPVIGDLRNAAEKNYHDRSLSELSKALGWHHGALAALLAGRQPEPAPVEPPDEPIREEIRLAREAVDAAERALRQAREALGRAGGDT